MMTNSEELYDSWIRKGSYFNRMIHCGSNFNQWIENALYYMPPDILDDFKEKLAFISTSQMDACRVARELCENREVILLSERILPSGNVSEISPAVRYFIFVVLHEVAHAVCKHRSPLFDSLTVEEVDAQENEADDLAFAWFNEYVEESNNPNIPKISLEEISEAKQKNQVIMERLSKDNSENHTSGKKNAKPYQVRDARTFLENAGVK